MRVLLSAASSHRARPEAYAEVLGRPSTRFRLEIVSKTKEGRGPDSLHFDLSL